MHRFFLTHPKMPKSSPIFTIFPEKTYLMDSIDCQLSHNVFFFIFGQKLVLLDHFEILIFWGNKELAGGLRPPDPPRLQRARLRRLGAPPPNPRLLPSALLRCAWLRHEYLRFAQMRLRRVASPRISALRADAPSARALLRISVPQHPVAPAAHLALRPNIWLRVLEIKEEFTKGAFYVRLVVYILTVSKCPSALNLGSPNCK